MRLFQYVLVAACVFDVLVSYPVKAVYTLFEYMQ